MNYLTKKINSKVKIYTDGSCFPNPDGYGGWSFVVVDKGRVVHSENGSDFPTTNNRMELTAIYHAMLWAEGMKCTIYSDSQYSVNTITEWYNSWVKKNKLGGKANIDILKDLMREYNNNNCDVEWVRGHDGNEFNEIADSLASKAMREAFELGEGAELNMRDYKQSSRENWKRYPSIFKKTKKKERPSKTRKGDERDYVIVNGVK